MGFYDDKVLPRVIEVTCGGAGMDELRRQACAPLSGAVVEVGFGSGFNVPLYPETVTSVGAVEPSDVAWERAADRVAASPIPVERSGLDGQRLPFDDDSFDGALSTFTLCTIPDLPAALAELRRVVRPGGELCFLEHGLAPSSGVQRFQRLFDPIEGALGGGCSLTRDIPAELEAAGWRIVENRRFYGKGVPKPWSAFNLGYATGG